MMGPHINSLPQKLNPRERINVVFNLFRFQIIFFDNELPTLSNTSALMSLIQLLIHCLQAMFPV